MPWTSIARAAVVATFFLAAGSSSASANMCDLTTRGSSCGPNGGNGWGLGGNQKNDPWAGGAIYQQIDPQPTGSGYIDSFVRVQRKGSEQGYNTDYRPVQFDEKTDATFTHSITVDNVPVVAINGKNYRQFFLDINENDSANGHLLSLDQLQVFLGPAGNLTGYSAASGGTLPSATRIYSLDTGTDNWIKLDYSLNSGSGSGDMAAYIPDSVFTNIQANPFVYLYSQFGATTGYGPLTSDAGFEEWWTNSPIALQVKPVPEPTGLLLLGSGLVAAARNLKRRKSLSSTGKSPDGRTKVSRTATFLAPLP